MKVSKEVEAKEYTVIKSHHNGFAQHIYDLEGENGENLKIIVNFGETEVIIKRFETREIA